MFRSLMAIIRELYLYLTKVIFMLKHSVKLRRYINYVNYKSPNLYTYLLHGAESVITPKSLLFRRKTAACFYWKKDVDS